MKRLEAQHWAALGVLLLAVVATYWNGLHGPFTYDDKVEVIGNETIRMLEQWRMVVAYNVSRPVTVMSYALNYHYAGAEPFTYHVVDVALHAVNAGLAMLLGSTIARVREHPAPLITGAAAALVWAVHPLNTEAVSYVTGRSEQLTALWVFLALWLWMRFSSEGDWRAWAGAWLCAVLGAFTKEVAVVLPVAFLVLDALVMRRVRWAAHLPGLVGLLGFFGLRYETYGDIISNIPPQRSMDLQLFTTVEVIVRYLALSVVPVGQSVFHDHPETGASVRSLAAGGFLVGVTGVALWKRHPIYSTAWLLFLLVLAPSSSFVALKETMAEHRMHVSLWALCFAAVWAVSRHEKARYGVLPVVLVFGALTLNRNRVWASEAALWADAAEKNPNSAEAWYGYGDALFLSRDLEGSAKAYARSTELSPDNPNAWNNLGRTEATLGNFDAAEDAWKGALKASPSYCRAHSNIAQLKMRSGGYREAETWFNTALAYCPKNCRAHAMLGRLYGWELDEKDNARAHFEVYLEHCDTDSQVAEVKQWVMELTW